jgi:uncharacterized membrane protein (DUF2068 family)
MSAHSPRVAPWEDFVLRLIALYKLAKMILFIAIGIGLIRIMHHNVAEILRVYVIEPMHFDPENRILQPILEKASLLTRREIESAGIVAFFYAALFGTEGFGLYFRKHWAEYLVLISTGSLLPIEFYEIFLQLAWWKVGVVVGNLAILFYLAHRLWLDSHTKSSGSDDDDDLSGPTGVNKSRYRKTQSRPDGTGRYISKVP